MRVLVVTSSGGHKTEMERLLPALEGHEVAWYIEGNPQTVQGAFSGFLRPPGRNPLRYAAGLLVARRIIASNRPDALLSTGSEVAIPFFLMARVMGVRSIYVESMARVNSRSVTGRVAYRCAADFYVQWPGMVHVYGAKAQYRGNLL